MNHTVLCIVFKTWHSPFMWGIVGNYIYRIYIFIGVNGNEGFVIPHWSTPPEPLQLFKFHLLVSLKLFKLHPLVSYKFRPPPPPPPHLLNSHFRAFEKNQTLHFPLSSQIPRVVCFTPLFAFEIYWRLKYRYTGKVLNRSILGGIILLTLGTEREIKFFKAKQ